MPKEIYPSSYECDCGHQSHFSENTVREIKAMSRKKKVRLGDSEPDEHIIVFFKGEMVDIICPHQKVHPPDTGAGMTESLDLSRKKLDPEPIAALALRDGRVLRVLLDGISPVAKKTAIRENSFKTLMLLAERHPEALFPHWEYLVSLLNCDNGSTKYAVIHLIAALAPADDAGRFEKAFDAFYALLGDESVMVASHVAGVSGKIAKAKPGLQSKITRRLMDTDQTHFDTSRRELVKSYIIEAFGEYVQGSRYRAKILAFVRQQLESTSPKTRKLARAFLGKWEK